MEQKMKNNSEITIRVPQEIKDKFAKYCDENLIGMSVKIRQLILKEINKKQ